MSYLDREREILDGLSFHITELAFPINWTPRAHSAMRMAEVILGLSETLVDDAESITEAMTPFLEHWEAALAEVDKEDVQSLARFLRDELDGMDEARRDWGFMRNLMHQQLRHPLMMLILNRDISELPKRVDRIGELLDLLVDTDLSPTSRKYLARAARLFIHGLKLESLVFCRSALEATLKAAIPDGVVMTTVGTGRSHEVGVSSRIQAALALGRLDRESAAKAGELVHAANSIIHDELKLPAGDQSVRAYIEKLRDVFACLHRTSGLNID